MPMPLDGRISQVAFTAYLLERALHDNGPWMLSWGGWVVPVQREFLDDGVRFTADIPEHCWLAHPESILLTLLCDGEMVAVKTLDHPGDGGFEVEWTLRATKVNSSV